MLDSRVWLKVLAEIVLQSPHGATCHTHDAFVSLHMAVSTWRSKYRGFARLSSIAVAKCVQRGDKVPHRGVIRCHIDRMQGQLLV